MRDWLSRNVRRDSGRFVLAVAINGLSSGLSGGAIVILYALFLAPLPVPRPQNLVSLSTTTATAQNLGISLPMLTSLQEHLGDRLELAAWAENRSELIEAHGQRVRRSVWTTSPNFFDVLQLHASSGRLLDRSDGDVTSMSFSPNAVVSRRFAEEYFGSASASLNKSIRLSGEEFTIIGVLPASFRGLGLSVDPSVFLPLPAQAKVTPQRAAALTAAGTLWMRVIARKTSDASVASITENLYGTWQEVKKLTVPASYEGTRRRDYLNLALVATSARSGVDDGTSRIVKPQVAAVMVVALFLFVLATVTYIFLDQTKPAVNTRTIALKFSLGARLGALVRSAWVEHVFHSLMSGSLAAAVAIAAVRLIQQLVLPSHVSSIPGDVNLAFFALGVSAVMVLVTTSANGIATTIRLNRIQKQSLQQTMRSRMSITYALVPLQLGVSVVLCCAAVALHLSAQRVQSIPLGIDEANLYTIDLGQPDASAARLGTAELLREVRALGNVRGAALSQMAPVNGAPVELVRHSDRPESETPAFTNSVSEGFFEAVGVQLIAGVEFNAIDSASSARVAILDRALAARLFSHGAGVGEFVDVGSLPERQRLQVVGIVGDAPLWDLRNRHHGMVYTPIAAEIPTASTLLVKAVVSSKGSQQLFHDVAEMTRGRAIKSEKLSDGIRVSTSRERAMASLAAWFAAVSSCVAAIGVYAFAKTVADANTRRIAVMNALGAPPFRLALCLGRYVGYLSAIGFVLGATLTCLSSRIVNAVVVGGATANIGIVAAVLGGASVVILTVSIGPIRRVVAHASSPRFLTQQN